MGPSRSCLVEFFNNTDVALVFDSVNLSGGIWSSPDLEPSPRIEPGERKTMGSESSGILTGTECEVDYRIELAPKVYAGYLKLYIPYAHPTDPQNTYTVGNTR
jgi:hypothetical protein